MILAGQRYVIEVYSELNPWLDCIFLVPERDAAEAQKVLVQAYNDYWEEETEEPYGEYFSRRMNDAGIAFEVFYGPEED